jgi:hypothetical protein
MGSNTKDHAQMGFALQSAYVHYARITLVIRRTHNPRDHNFRKHYGPKKITGEWLEREWVGPAPLTRAVNIVSYLCFAAYLELFVGPSASRRAHTR